MLPKIIIPFQEVNQNSNIELILLLKSLKFQKFSFENIFVVNHTGKSLSLFLLKELKDIGLNLKINLISENITLDKFYSGTLAKFLLMPEVLLFMSDRIPGPYLMLDPDVICQNLNIPIVLFDEVYVYKSPEVNLTKFIKYYTNLIFEKYQLPYSFSNHFDSWYILTNNKAFIKDWYNDTILFTKLLDTLNLPEGFKNSLMVFNEEIILSNLESKYKFMEINENSNAHIHQNELIDYDLDYSFFHYDYLHILYSYHNQQPIPFLKEIKIDINNLNKFPDYRLSFDDSILEELKKITNTIIQNNDINILEEVNINLRNILYRLWHLKEINNVN